MKLIGSKRSIRSPEFHRKKELQRKLYLGLLAFMGSAIIVLPAYILGSEFIQVRKVEVEGNVVTKDKEIIKTVRDALRGEYLGFVPKSSIIFYPQGEVEESLLGKIPRLASVYLARTSPSSIKVLVSEREPVALSCGEGCYLVDKTGFIFAPALEFDRGVYTVFKLSQGEPILGERVLEEENFERLMKFVSGLKLLGLNAEQVARTESGLTIHLSEGPELRWKEDQDLEKLLVDLNSFLTAEDTTRIKLGELLYIDLSFDNKIHWVYKDGR